MPSTTATTFSSFLTISISLLLVASLPLSCNSNHIRRILHQPFFPLPPSSSPTSSDVQSTPPKFPFSTSTPPGTPFFPTYHSPPPPPSPVPFVSIPGNVSDLDLPHSPKPHSSSSKLVAVTIAAAILAVVVIGIVVVYFCRRRLRNRSFVGDEKTYGPSANNVQRYNTPSVEAVNGSNRKVRATSTSSEFLYLGTLVDSIGVNDETNVELDHRKLDSPELRPLPPLNMQSSRLNYGNGEVGSTTGEDEDEFYSPRGSIGERNSFGGAGSGSRRMFANLTEADFGRRSVDSRSSTCTSSSTVSPSRSISTSPPVSLSPFQKSPETTVFTSVPPPHPPFSNHGVFSRSGINSPSLSMVSSSPERDLVGSLPESERVLKVSNQNVRSPSLSPARIDKEINLNVQSLSLSSRSTSSNRSWAASPRMSSELDRNVGSPLHMSSASTSPDRTMEKNTSLPLTSSPSFASSPEPGLKKSPALNVKISNAIELLPISVTAPPPLPPPLPTRKHWEPLTTPTGQPISRPPPLIPPSRPFVLQSTAKVSPIDMPPSSIPVENSDETPKPKLKPLHWDKVRASSDREMVWDQLRSSSFKLNEEMIETLFVNNPTPKTKQTTPRALFTSTVQENIVLDAKKSQNIAILLRAFNVTVEEVCEALLEGNVDMLGSELLENLLKMAPTKEEERKLKDYKDESPTRLGPAEKFLKAVIDIPFAFKRVDVMLYIANFESEIEFLKKSFETLEAACEELRNSRMFLKLLEAVLKTGNRMNVGTNRGDAHAFKLDTLLKLVDVKGADGKTTLLHFVVQEIIRTEGARCLATNSTPNPSDDATCRKLGLQVVSSLSSELTDVKKAAAMDSDVLGSEVSKLSIGIDKISQVMKLVKTTGPEEDTLKFLDSMEKFMKMAEEEIIRMQAQESVALSLVKEITEYFHGNSAKEEAHPFRIFMVVRDFQTILDKVCKEVGMINERTIFSSASLKFPVPVNPLIPQVYPVNPTIPQVFTGYQAGCNDQDSSP